MTLNQLTTTEWWQTAEKAQNRVRQYFESRGMHDHSIRNIQQTIYSVIEHMIISNTGGMPWWTSDEFDPVKYLANLVLESEDNPRISVKRKAEDRFALEILAEELRIKDDMIAAILARRCHGRT